MTSYTPILAIEEAAPTATDKVPTINDGFVKIEAATQQTFSTVFSSNLRTLTADEFTGNVNFQVSATFSATGTLTIPLTQRDFYVDNSVNPSHGCVVKAASGATVTVPAGVIANIYCDGTNVLTPSALGAVVAGVSSVNTRTGAVVLGATDLLALNTGKIIGRANSGSGASEEIAIGAGLTLIVSGGVGTLSSTALGEALYWAGTWNASTNSPTLSSGSGTAGALYTVTTAGTTTLDGISSWNIGDKVAFDGVASVWRKIDGLATEVVSVAGRTGAVTLTGADIGLNLGAIVYTAGDLLVANGSSYASMPVSGDITINSGGTATLGSIVAGATVGSAIAVPVVTYDNKGRVTGTSTAAIGANVTLSGTAAGTLSINPGLGTTDVIVNMPSAGGTVTLSYAGAGAFQPARLHIKQGATAGVVVLNSGTVNGFVFGATQGPTSFTITPSANVTDMLAIEGITTAYARVTALDQGFTA